MRTVIHNTIESIGAKSMKDMGRVMGVAMKELKGTTDGTLVQKIVQEALSL